MNIWLINTYYQIKTSLRVDSKIVSFGVRGPHEDATSESPETTGHSIYLKVVGNSRPAFGICQDQAFLKLFNAIWNT